MADSKKSWSLALLAMAAFAVALAASHGRLARRANLAVSADGFRHVYVQQDVDRPGRCVVGDRSTTSIKRSDRGPTAAKWDCWEAGDGIVASAKRRPSYFFVPHTAVGDPLVPTLYQRVRADLELPLPEIEWVELFRDRGYTGLHLAVELPGRRFAAERGWERLELLTVAGDGLVCSDRKLRPRCPLLAEVLGGGVLPRPHQDAGRRRLATAVGAPATSFLLAAGDLSAIEPWPLPIDLRQIQRGEAAYRDARAAGWVGSEPSLADRRALIDEHRLELVDELEHLRPALIRSCRVRGCDGSAELAASRLVKLLDEGA